MADDESRGPEELDGIAEAFDDEVTEVALFGRRGDPAGKIEELAVKAECCTLVVILETIAPGAAVRGAAGLAYGDGR